MNEPPRRLAKRLALALLAAALVLACGYGILAYRLNRQPINVARNYAAELNAPILKIPEERRAWTHYRRALEKLEASGPTAREPKDENWAEMAAYLDRNAEAIAMLRQAAAIPQAGILIHDGVLPADVAWLKKHALWQLDPAEAPTDNPLLFGIVQYEASGMLDVVRVLSSDARRAVETGDASRAADDILAMLGGARQFGQPPFFINHLVSLTIRDMAVNLLGELLAEKQDRFDGAHLARLAAGLDEIRKQGVAIGLEGQRLSYQDLAQRCFTDDGEGDGMFSFAGMASLDGSDPDAEQDEESDDEWRHWSEGLPALSPLLFASRKESAELFDRQHASLVRYASTPLWLRSDDLLADHRAVSAMLASGSVRCLVLEAFVNDATDGLSAVANVAEYGVQRLDAARTAIALVRFERQHAAWPEKLTELVPKVLSEVPPDRFDGQSLRYRLAAGKPVVYSVGANLRDDGGQPPATKEGRYEVERWPPDDNVEGDWILWPPLDPL